MLAACFLWHWLCVEVYNPCALPLPSLLSCSLEGDSVDSGSELDDDGDGEAEDDEEVDVEVGEGAVQQAGPYQQHQEGPAGGGHGGGAAEGGQESEEEEWPVGGDAGAY